MRTKRAFKVKEKAFFIIFKGLLAAKNNIRLKSAPLNIYIFKTLFNIAIYKTIQTRCPQRLKHLHRSKLTLHCVDVISLRPSITGLPKGSDVTTTCGKMPCGLLLRPYSFCPNLITVEPP